MEKMTNEQYAEALGQVCPYCRGQYVYATERVDLVGTTALQPVKCGSGLDGRPGCGKRWTEEYNLTGYSEDDTSDEDDTDGE